MNDYFHKTKIDSLFYEQYLLKRLPENIMDAHAHLSLPEHLASISPETIAGDWAVQCGAVMTYEDACHYTKIMFPDKQWNFIGLPFPLREADTDGNNAYIASLIKNHSISGLYTLRPEYKIEKIEKEYQDGHFSGFKPYPYMASAVKGANVSIFEFMTHEQFKLANSLNAAVLMHLPRAGRLPDPDNVKEILTILDNYPNIKLVLAHFGRCFQHEYFEKALKALGENIHRVWFDCSAVLNPKVYNLAFNHLDHHRILFGTDLPIFLWHGKREWNSLGYHNLCREKFPWNKHPYPQEEETYTFFLYEQLNNILNVIGETPDIIHDVFYNNAKSVYGKKA